MWKNALNIGHARAGRWSVSGRTMAMALIGLGAASVLSSPASAQFQAGDLYLFSSDAAQTSPQYPCGSPCLIRISTTTWEASLVTRFTGVPTSAAYDAFRQQILVGLDLFVEGIRADGTVAANLPSLGANFAHVVMPTGDGRVYLRGGDSSNVIKYFDAANTVHTLMDSSGTAAFTRAGIFRVGMYDADSNSLFLAEVVGADITQVTKIPLNTAGDKVAGVVRTATFNASPGNSPVPVAITKGPAGKVFVKIDDNGGALEPRMQLVDTTTMQVTVFASSNYTGIGGETIGAYLPARQEAMVLDTFSNLLRSYHQGESGGGVSHPTTGVAISTDCGAGETGWLIPIDGPAHCPADFDDGSGTGTPDGGVTIDDLLYYLVIYQDGATAADLDDGTGTGTRDGGVTIDDLLFMLAHYAAGC